MLLIVWSEFAEYSLSGPVDMRLFELKVGRVTFRVSGVVYSSFHGASLLFPLYEFGSMAYYQGLSQENYSKIEAHLSSRFFFPDFNY